MDNINQEVDGDVRQVSAAGRDITITHITINNPQNVNTADVVSDSSNQRSSSSQQGSLNQQDASNQQDTSNQQSISIQQGTSNQQDTSNQQSTSIQQGAASLRSISNQQGSAGNSTSGYMLDLQGYIANWKDIHDKKKFNDAAILATKIAKKVTVCDRNEIQKLHFLFYSHFEFITNCCIEDEQFDAGTSMALSRFTILCECCKDNISALLESLEQVGHCFVILATKKNALGKSEKVRHLCVHIDTVIEFMINVCSFNSDNRESMVKKNQCIFSVLLRYGPLCITVKDFPKALAIFSQAVSMIKTLYGLDAKKSKILVVCYYNIGYSYNELGQPYRAINVIKDAICTCKSVNTWENENEKSLYVVICTKYLELLESTDTSAKR